MTTIRQPTTVLDLMMAVVLAHWSLSTINPRCGWQPYVSSRVRVTPEWCQSNHAMEHFAPSSVRMPQLPGSVRIKPVIGYALLHLA
eukprot:scaffold50064_cov298-Isochrysis_galbana.AAC.3